MKKNVLIYGLGKGFLLSKKILKQENVNIVRYVDQNYIKYDNGLEGIPVISPHEINKYTECDYVIITLMNYDNIKEFIMEQGIKRERIICIYDITHSLNSEFYQVIAEHIWKSEIMLHQYLTVVHPFMENMKYELADEIKKEQIQLPRIESIEESVNIIQKNRLSVCRFGDDEFELIRMKQRTKYQRVDDVLSQRLLEVLHTNDTRVAVGIANNYGSLLEYTDAAAYSIRNYLTKETREFHMSVLDMKKKYIDAYLSRPYIIYKDKERAGERFKQLQTIWENQDILIIEGMQTRMGVGNDLFVSTKSIQRLLAPSENAFSSYGEIFVKAKKYGKDKLILIALGPTATVLAYDLAKEGYWAIDIGHIDLEYEWFKRKALDKCIIEYKYINEVAHGENVFDGGEFQKYKEVYEKEIIDRVI